MPFCRKKIMRGRSSSWPSFFCDPSFSAEDRKRTRVLLQAYNGACYDLNTHAAKWQNDNILVFFGCLDWLEILPLIFSSILDCTLQVLHFALFYFPLCSVAIPTLTHHFSPYRFNVLKRCYIKIKYLLLQNSQIITIK